jgi:hypothetical protein
MEQVYKVSPVGTLGVTAAAVKRSAEQTGGFAADLPLPRG